MGPNPIGLLSLGKKDSWTEMLREKAIWRLELSCDKPRNYQKLGEGPGTDLAPEPSEGA